ncbi:glycosyl transferase [Roseobacter sp. GAI101]|uniref:glycosyl transferase n=1 Tax=Roseobacter sp. (strain GAI101) TaxID=391589 RepID=UPI00018723B7|nr:glycosyl transferase [Roseobacter sp. GAI101]EEB82921.1 glycosyltransferase involved in cell wall biogenesis [Roseobacter sp. GAI101]
MSDFHQNGNIATLHNLRTRSLDEMTYELETFAQNRKMALILPCLYSELETDAMPKILAELSKVTYLHRIIIGLDRADEAQFRHAKEFFKGLNQKHIVIWNDSPRMLELGARLDALGLAPSEQGKGKNVWTALGYLMSCQDSAVMALHDCDIVTYTNELLARLIYPVANPNFPYQVAKGYYARVGSDKLNGRVTRLLVSPLLIALKKVVGDRDYIEYLRSFRYPLSGEFAMRTGILPDLRIPSDWGLEIGVLSEAWRNLAPKAVCQVEICDNYDHKHQDLSPEDATAGLSRMSTDICKAIFRKLAADGTIFTNNIFRTLKATYYRTALDLLEAYHADAIMNGLTIDRHKEEQAIELFAENIMRAGNFFIENPHETPFIPTWNRVHAADPDFLADLHAAAAADEAEFV